MTPIREPETPVVKDSASAAPDAEASTMFASLTVIREAISGLSRSTEANYPMHAAIKRAKADPATID